jgi:maleylpyruvate isomerase
MPDPQVLALLEAGTRRLVRTVDGLADEQWPQPSLLPGWSRAHVVAHLTLNAEGLSTALEGVHEGRPVPMYASQEARDGDIAALATSATPSELRDRFLASTTVIGEWVEELADNLADHEIQRVPGGPGFPAGAIGEMRVREVEIHHADLGSDYAAADWSAEFVTMLLDGSSAVDEGDSFTLHATDLDRTWTFGSGGPTVSGVGSALAWWATGRGSGDVLTSDDGRLPRIEAW